MLPELGLVLLALSLMLALALSVLPLVGAQRGQAAWMATARPLSYALFTVILASYLLLTWAFLAQDFSVAYVAQNSNSLLPREYQITAVWSAQGGPASAVHAFNNAIKIGLHKRKEAFAAAV